MLLLFQTAEAWTWPGIAGVAGSIFGSIVLFSVLVKAIKDIRKDGWEPFRDKWISPWKFRRAARFKRQEELFAKVEGVVTSCEKLGGQVSEILREVKPNGGTSLKDRVVGIDSKLDDVIAERQHQNETSDEAIFKLNAEGEMIYSNCAFREMVNAEEAQLGHNNYLSLMDDDTRRRFVRTRKEAIDFMMPLDAIVNFKLLGPRHVSVRLQASPDVRTGGDLKGFFGTASIVDTSNV